MPANEHVTIYYILPTKNMIVHLFRSSTQLKRFISFGDKFIIKFDHDFSPSEEDTILQKLNSYSVEELKRFSITQNRAVKLVAYRKKHGDYKTLASVLAVENFGTSVLKSLCKSILNPPSAVEQAKVIRKTYNFVTPELTEIRKQKMNNVVGVSLGPLSVSWAGINAKENELFAWGHHALSLPPQVKRHHEIQILDVAYDAYSQIPVAETYVLESNWAAGGTQQPANMVANQFRLQLSTMLLVLLNQSAREKGEDSNVICQRNSLWCRLYGTLVGSERVSAHSVFQKIEAGEPGPYSSIHIPPNLKELYFGSPALQRESLCAAFLLTLCFLDVSVKSLPVCLKILRGRLK